ncbi:MAG TPA: hypothetical protein VI385_05330 [Flavisolibacter sp.]
MKTMLKRIIDGLVCCLLLTTQVSAQDEKPELMLNLRHFTENNSLQYLKVKAQQKANNKLQPLKDLSVKLYLDSLSASNLIGEIKTDEGGQGQTIIPATLRTLWSVTPSHKFIAVAKPGAKAEETTTELEIARAKIELDTLNSDGTRSVIAKVFSFSNGEWIPSKGVEVKIGVERLGGSLKIGDEETYTTDSLGQVSGDFKLDSLPSDDTKGNIVLVAKVEDNDQFGDLSIEKKVPWGRWYQHVNTFGQRSLSAARFRAPLWLLFMAYSIVTAVWGVIIYLLIQLYRMKRLPGEETKRSGEVQVKGSSVIS